MFPMLISCTHVGVQRKYAPKSIVSVPGRALSTTAVLTIVAFAHAANFSIDGKRSICVSNRRILDKKCNRSCVLEYMHSTAWVRSFTHRSLAMWLYVEDLELLEDNEGFHRDRSAGSRCLGDALSFSIDGNENFCVSNRRVQSKM